MKAREYVDLFGKRIAEGTKEEAIRAGAEMLTEMFYELEQIRKERHVSTDKGLMGCIRTQNQKYLAILSKLPQPSILKRSAFIQTVSDALQMEIKL